MSNIRAEVGNRAEEVANWYFRLNGFFLLPAYIIHKDYRADKPKTEADLIGVRMRKAAEYIRGERLEDDSIIQNACKVKGTYKHLFALIEVKAGMCAINGTWARSEEKNIQQAIQRMGFAEENQIDTIAQILYIDLRWEGKDFVVQYFCIGKERNPELSAKPKLIQITFREIAGFFYNRFKKFPEKIPDSVVLQWPGFGRAFAYWFDAYRETVSEPECEKAIFRFIETGFVSENRCS